MTVHPERLPLPQLQAEARLDAPWQLIDDIQRFLLMVDAALCQVELARPGMYVSMLPCRVPSFVTSTWGDVSVGYLELESYAIRWSVLSRLRPSTATRHSCRRCVLLFGLQGTPLAVVPADSNPGQGHPQSRGIASNLPGVPADVGDRAGSSLVRDLLLPSLPDTRLAA